jgi:hypothetical protein
VTVSLFFAPEFTHSSSTRQAAKKGDSHRRAVIEEQADRTPAEEVFEPNKPN